MTMLNTRVSGDCSSTLATPTTAGDTAGGALTMRMLSFRPKTM